uniref:Ovule protein n=1 Tax=Parascaris univalens TaxID=6257 RepID=A0A914ZUG5_PARUN
MPKKRLFIRAFRQASPSARERSFESGEYDYSDEEDNAIGEISEAALRQMTNSIERLTELARRESFSSIRSGEVRQQFATALNNLQDEVFANIEDNFCQSGVLIQNQPTNLCKTTTTVQYRSVAQITMESNIRQSIGDQQTEQSQADLLYEENIIDLDSPAERISTVTQNQPIQASASNISRSHLTIGSASSRDSEDSNGFVKVEHLASDLLGDFDHSHGDVPLVPERIPYDFSRGEETTPSDETSSLSSDMDQQHMLPKASELAESTFERVSDVAASGYEKVSGVTTAAADAAKSVLDTVSDTAHNIYGSAADTKKSAEEKATEVAHDIVGVVSDTAKAAQDKASEAAHTAYTTAANTVKSVEEKTLTTAHAGSDLLGETIHLVHEKADDAYDSVADMARNAKEAGRDAVGAATEKADDLYTSAKGSVQGAYDTVTGAAHEAADGVKEGTHDAFGAVVGATEGIKEKARNVAETAKESIKAAYEKGAEAVHGVGEKGGEAVGLAEGKSEDEYDKLSDLGHAAYDTTADALKGAGERVEDAMHTAHGITSENLKGVGEALEGAVYTAYDATSSTVTGTSEALGSEVKKVKDAGEVGFEKVEESVGGADEDFDLFDPLKQVAAKVTRGTEDLHGTGSDSFQDTVRNEVAGVHDQIDSLIQKMHEDAEDAQAYIATQQKSLLGEAVGVSLESSTYGRGSSPDENTFDRKGPLTIPSPKEEKTDDSLVRLEDEPRAPGGFDMEPRPPTPPKELDDEDVKPTTIDVGPPPPYKASVISDRPRSILKHSVQGPWFDFKSVDPRHVADTADRHQDRSRIRLIYV